MAGQLFDVFVVGSADPTPAGETRLATALSSKHGVPLTTVAKAISTKNLRAGQSLEQAQAQALVRQLQSMGAVTVIRPATGAGRTPAPVTPPAPAGRSFAPTMAPASGRQTMVPASAPSNFGPPLVAPSEPAAPGGAFPPLQAANQVSVQSNPLAPPPVGAIAPRVRGTRTPSPPPGQPHASPVPGTDAFQADLASGPKLELARGNTSGQSEDALPSRPTSSPTSLRDIGATQASGLGMDEDPKNLNLVRCAQHGLYYDRTKASGCRKCMSVAREVAMGLQERTTQTQLKVANLRDQPAKRAFIGLAIALVLGLLPAAYYAFGPGSADARELRVRQEVLSRQPGTEEILHQFEELDEQVNRSRDRSLRNIALVWAATSIAAMAGWYKLT